MRKILALCLLCSWTFVVKAQPATLPFYPEIAPLQTHLQALAARYPQIVKLETLGSSRHDNLPVLALKLSDHVDQTEDEPVWVFNGMIHGSEQLGLPIVLSLAEELAAGYGHDAAITSWLDAYEIWLVMSINPWGYSHSSGGSSSVTGTRRNGMTTSDPVTTGVDLARNYDFRWNQGGSTAPGDSDYRGMQPFSESDTQAIRDLYLTRKPLFGTTFHQGNEPDGGQVMRPWSSSIGSPPDASVLSAFAQKYAGWVFGSRQQGPLCQKQANGTFVLEDPDGVRCGTSEITQGFCAELCWMPEQATLGAYGQPSNWYYAAVGTVEFTIEISDRLFNVSSMHTLAGPQNDRERTIEAVAKEIARNHRQALKQWLGDFLYSTSPVQFRGPGLTGRVTDSRTAAPLVASITVSGFHNAFLQDRLSDARFGRYWRLLPAGLHSVTVKASGYHDWQGTVNVTDGSLTELDIQLTPLSTGIEEGTEVPTIVTLTQNYPNPFQDNTHISYSLSEVATDELSLFDVLGRKVQTLFQGMQSPGSHTVLWDGVNEAGQPVSNGAYYYRLIFSNGASKGTLSRMLIVNK